MSAIGGCSATELVNDLVPEDGYEIERDIAYGADPRQTLDLYRPDEIVKLVMRAFKPGTWDDEEGTFIQGLGTSIVVKHDANVHREVQKLLTQLHLLGPFPHGTQQGFGGGGGGVSAPGGGGGVF